jgi:hypothetical protein
MTRLLILLIGYHNSLMVSIAKLCDYIIAFSLCACYNFYDLDECKESSPVIPDGIFSPLAAKQNQHLPEKE